MFLITHRNKRVARVKTLRKLRNAGYSIRVYVEMLNRRITGKIYNYQEHGD